MANKFKVGDFVKANPLSNRKYCVTCQRNKWVGKVVEILDDEFIRVSDMDDCGYCVSSSCFDLINYPYEIHIYSDGRVTKASLRVAGQTEKAAETRCNPHDKFDIANGAKIVINRMFGKLDHEGVDSVKPDYGKIRRKHADSFKVGDIVKISSLSEIEKKFNSRPMFGFPEKMERELCGRICVIKDFVYVPSAGAYRVEFYNGTNGWTLSTDHIEHFDPNKTKD